MKTLIALFAFALVAVNAQAGNNKPVPAFAENVVSSKMTVHADEKGNVFAISRFISDVQLPLPVLKKLMTKCPDETIVSIREFDAGGAITYIMALENEKGYKVVRIAGSSLTTLDKVNKSL